MTSKLKSSKKQQQRGRGLRKQPGRHKVKPLIKMQELSNRRLYGNAYGE